MRLPMFAASLCALALGPAWAHDESRLPRNASFTTLSVTPFAIEGLTGDAAGNLYTTGRQPDTTKNCPVWRIGADGSRTTVGFIANSTGCNPSGITFDRGGDLYIADAATISGVSGFVWKVTPHPIGCQSDDSAATLCAAVPLASAFVSGVPGTNGLAFDRDGNLWTGDGTTGLGRVWRISTNGTVTEAFRVQPMANSVGVGREARTLPPGTAQPLVANGVAFTHDGSLLVADTGRGALWRVDLDATGNVLSPTGCDTTFTANTLCLDNVWVEHPYLEGADGIALDTAGNVWAAANERNAIVVASQNGSVSEFFRNPADSTTHLRNGGPL